MAVSKSIDVALRALADALMRANQIGDALQAASERPPQWVWLFSGEVSRIAELASDLECLLRASESTGAAL